MALTALTSSAQERPNERQSGGTPERAAARPMGAERAGADRAGAERAGAERAADVAMQPDVTTQGSVEVGGQQISYTAVAGIITVASTDTDDAELGPDGKPAPGSEMALATKDPAQGPPLAHMFYVAYFKTGADAEHRPVTFFYNGGPGSSTMWLHMGSLGPKSVDTNTDEHLPGAPYLLRDNPDCLLDVSDEVFIDMPGTGFGRLTGKDPGKAFWGVDQDAQAFARFITRFLTKYNRWNSPKYVFGESYGTTRSAVLANDLENRNIDLNGVMLLGEILNFGIGAGVGGAHAGMDLPYALALPSYAATAWYHKKLSPEPASLDSFLQGVEDFALGEYLHALALGTDLSETEKQADAEKIHEYTALPVDYVLKADLRVAPGEFEKNLDADEDMTTGRYDTRFLGPTMDPLSETAEYDPQSSAISSAYYALLNVYLRDTLNYGDGQTYIADAIFGGTRWDMTRQGRGRFGGGGGGALNVMPDLADAMKANPNLHVMLNDGYFDLATPFFAAEYEEKHLPIPQSLAKNISYNWYESGHMAYVRDSCRKLLHDRAAAFIKETEAETK
ncbi:MAG: S10 family peptidase [Terracidiphilus sp.]